jgi:transcriptional regulator with XRE-family HTH domain
MVRVSSGLIGWRCIEFWPILGAVDEDTIGQRIATGREKLGMSQAELANAIGVRQQTVAAWESDVNVPPTTKLGPLSDLLDVSIDYLVLGRTPDGEDERARIRRLRKALDRIEEGLNGDLDQ